MSCYKKKQYAFGLLLTVTFFTGCLHNEKKISAPTSLTHEQYYAGLKLSVLFNLMDTLGLQYEKTVKGIVDATQKNWLRKGERWETDDLFEDKKEELRNYFDQLGLVNAWMPQRKSYDGVLFTGSLLFSMRNKLDFLLSLNAQNVQFDTVVILTGKRFLIDREKEALKNMGADLDIVKTETDVARFLFQEAQKNGALKGIKVVVVDAPEVQLENGKTTRPTTADTVNQWIKDGAQPGHYLVISQQPYCTNQKVVLETLLPDSFVVEVVGKSDDYKSRVAMYLDTITRTLYHQSKVQS